MKRYLHKAVSVIFLDGDDVRRAPMVAALFKDFVRNETVLKLWNLKVDSAGSGQFTKEGAAPEKPAISAMNSLGLDISSHRARAIMLEDLRKASLILAMEQKHINYVAKSVCDGLPGYQKKMITLNDYLGGGPESKETIERKLIDIRDVRVYEEFAKYQQLLFTRVAFLLKKETLYPLLLKGYGVSTGAVEARVKVVHSPSDARMLNTGDIMVCKSNHVIQLYGQDCVRMAAGIITDSASEMSHLSELSYEMNIPCIGGTGTASLILKDGQVITLDGTSGLVYGGEGEW